MAEVYAPSPPQQQSNDDVCNPTGPSGLSGGQHANRYSYKVLKSLCNNNLRYFNNDRSELGKRFMCSFQTISDLVDALQLQVDGIGKVVHHFDLDEHTPGNGFRSCLMVIDKCVQSATKLSKTVCLKRDSMLFRRLHYVKEVENVASVMGSLYDGLQHVKKLLVWNRKGELYPEDHQTAEDLLFEVECVDQASFYGRSVGFQVIIQLRAVVTILYI